MLTLISLTALSTPAAAQEACDGPPSSPSGVVLSPKADPDLQAPSVLVGESLHAGTRPILTADLGKAGIITIGNEEGVAGLSTGFPGLTEGQVERVVVPAERCPKSGADVVIHPPDPGRELAFTIPSDCTSEGVLTLRAELVDGAIWDLDLRARDESGKDVLQDLDIFGFNPQPEPPAVIDLIFGNNTTLNGGSTVEVGLEDVNGTVIGF